MQPSTQLSPLRGVGEVAEDEAGPELARTYARLHRALGVAFVPTVYRMLGRWPGYLAAATDALAPALASESAERFAAAARARAVAVELPGSPIDAGPSAPEILALLERYNTANPRSLLFASALAPGALPPGGLMEPEAISSTEPADAAALLEEIRTRHGGFVLPGVWRELAGRPAVARAAWREVRPLARIPAFHDARAAIRELAIAQTAAVAAPELAERHVAREDRADLERIVSWFAHGIPAVLVEIEHLRRLIKS